MMDKHEARRVLQQQLVAWRAKPYGELVSLIGEPSRAELSSPGGSTYQVVIEAFWEDRSGGNVRVMGAIDDGGISAFLPMSEDFIVDPSGGFVGEASRG